MTASFQPNTPAQGQTTLQFTYVKDTLVMQEAGNHIAEFLYNRLSPTEQAALGPNFGSLTQQQKLTLIDNAVIDMLRAWNRANIRNQEEVNFQSDIDTRYISEGI